MNFWTLEGKVSERRGGEEEAAGRKTNSETMELRRWREGGEAVGMGRHQAGKGKSKEGAGSM